MNITDKFGTNLSTTTLHQLARVAETAELYHDCYEFMAKLTQQKSQNNSYLDIEERNILSVSVKNIIGTIRASLRALPEEKKEDHYNSYKNHIKSELFEICQKYITLITKYILPTITGNNDETEVFYHKALGDTYRYLAEYFDAKSYAKNAEKYYKSAMNIALQNLNETHPTRLGLALNFSVFYKEILNEPDKACKLAKVAFDSSIEKLDTLNDASYKDSTLVMQLLRDNLTTWTGDGAVAMDDDADDGCIGFAVGGARDVNNFRECIENGIMPKVGSITYNGLLYEYYFDTKKKGKSKKVKEEVVSVEDDEGKDDGSRLFYPSYCYARVNKLDFDDDMKDGDDVEGNEYYMTVGLNSNIKQKDFKRKALNLVVVLDKSGSMDDCFNNERADYHRQYENGNVAKRVKTKMDVANECIVDLLQHLTPKDRFGLIVFDNKSAVKQEMILMKDVKDLDGLKEDILGIRAGGGTNFECGYESAIKMYIDGNIMNDEEYDNRVIILTDAQPNIGRTDPSSLLSMVDTNANNINNYIYTTFIGVGLDFNAKLIQQISNTRGCNYYSVQSTSNFKQVMNEDFEFMVTPLVFNVCLKLKAEGDSLCINKVYGVSAGNEEEMMNTGEITKINTLFPSKKSKAKGGTKGGIQLIKLKNSNDNKNKKGFNVEVEVSFEDKYGKTYKNIQHVALDGDDDENADDMIESNDYFDNTGIRKGILLCKYVELMLNWMQYEEDNNNNDDQLRVNDKYKKMFCEFLIHFEKEMKDLQDDDLQKEVNLMKKLVNNE